MIGTDRKYYIIAARSLFTPCVYHATIWPKPRIILTHLIWYKSVLVEVLDAYFCQDLISKFLQIQNKYIWFVDGTILYELSHHFPNKHNTLGGVTFISIDMPFLFFLSLSWKWWQTCMYFCIQFECKLDVEPFTVDYFKLEWRYNMFF